ncbi:Fanconi anemia, complementation group D2 [Operophtera brumata]|uniref:Fanconi anemia, complementation group D2 n=1 Tax=Operophtera brumata TaxID=104452 RepID=A0A0L7KUT5_OPEBR|nr:Fanconi anemia, complementation group D2 [Operophtera brumata]
MSSKRTLSQRSNSATRSDSKKLKVVDSTNYLHKTLKDSGLILKHPPEKCTSSSHKTIDITRNIKKNLEKHFEYPQINNKNCSTYDIPDDVVNQVGKGRPKETGEASTSSSVAIIIEDPGDFQFNFEI